MPNRLTQWISFVLAAATIFLFGYGVGRVQNIADTARLYRDIDTDRYTLIRGGIQVHFERLGGAGKPYIRTPDGIELLDFSDWDRNSRIVVDGAAYELIRVYPGSAVDYERSRIASSFRGDGWLLEREITLDDDGTVQVAHTFVARRPIQRVDLSVAHVHTVFLDADFSDPRTLTATESDLTREQVLSGAQRKPVYRLAVSAENGRPTFRRGDDLPQGVVSFIADFGVSNPPLNERVLLGRERVRVERIAG